MADKKTSVKKRNWAFVVYPTKAQLEALGSTYDGNDGYGMLPDDWVEIMQLSGLQYAISPLHDKDFDPENNKMKKPHYHVIVCYGNPTTFNNVQSLTNRLNAPIPQALETVRGYYRYLTHKDNPDKYQYDENQIVVGGGFNIADYIELTKSEVNKIKFDLQKLIRQEDICEYEILMDYIQDNLDQLCYDVASSNTMFFNTYLRSRRHRIDREHQPQPKAVECDKLDKDIDINEDLKL